MDYAFVHAINHIPLSRTVLLLYDIMCQYWKYFKSRIKEMPDFLALPRGLKIKCGIGLFHVHGHMKECFARYAPTFIKGAGMLDVSVMSTDTWSVLLLKALLILVKEWPLRQLQLQTFDVL